MDVYTFHRDCVCFLVEIFSAVGMDIRYFLKFYVSKLAQFTQLDMNENRLWLETTLPVESLLKIVAYDMVQNIRSCIWLDL